MLTAANLLFDRWLLLFKKLLLQLLPVLVIVELFSPFGLFRLDHRRLFKMFRCGKTMKKTFCFPRSAFNV